MIDLDIWGFINSCETGCLSIWTQKGQIESGLMTCEIMSRSSYACQDHGQDDNSIFNTASLQYSTRAHDAYRREAPRPALALARLSSLRFRKRRVNGARLPGRLAPKHTSEDDHPRSTRRASGLCVRAFGLRVRLLVRAGWRGQAVEILHVAGGREPSLAGPRPDTSNTIWKGIIFAGTDVPKYPGGNKSQAQIQAIIVFAGTDVPKYQGGNKSQAQIQARKVYVNASLFEDKVQERPAANEEGDLRDRAHSVSRSKVRLLHNRSAGEDLEHRRWGKWWCAQGSIHSTSALSRSSQLIGSDWLILLRRAGLKSLGVFPTESQMMSLWWALVRIAVQTIIHMKLHRARLEHSILCLYNKITFIYLSSAHWVNLRLQPTFEIHAARASKRITCNQQWVTKNGGFWQHCSSASSWLAEKTGK